MEGEDAEREGRRRICEEVKGKGDRGLEKEEESKVGDLEGVEIEGGKEGRSMREEKESEAERRVNESREE